MAAALSLFSLAAVPPAASAAGVTLITHGLNGNVDGWITGMANQIPNYSRFFGTNFTIYEMYFYSNSGAYYLTSSRVSGLPPSGPESGEIIVKLDWRQLADGNSYNTYQIAAAVGPALLDTNFISELGGHALAELPLHLIGHSRGGSLICEISRLLGTNGLWVDHLTTLDPHPLNNDGFNLDFFLYSDVDAPARTYTSVLFHDNYWQDLSSPINGEPVSGAYVRKLTNLNGGYGGTGGSHSDVHLWYHGTIDWRTPTSDTEASITATERSAWWVSYEQKGTNAGFQYSLIGGSDRLSSDRPLGGSNPAIRDGFNQWWDLGAGVASNRTALTTNNGNWPNLIRLDRTATNQVVQGQSTPLRLYYQWARPSTNLASVSVYLDNDLNPLNTNHTLLTQFNLPGNGASSVSYLTTNITLAASNATPGWHTFFATITAAGRTRYLYAPEWVQVVSPTPPSLDVISLSASQLRIGVNGQPGQTIVLLYSADLQSWLPLATNLLATNRWVYTDTPPPSLARRFYGAVLP